MKKQVQTITNKTKIKNQTLTIKTKKMKTSAKSCLKKAQTTISFFVSKERYISYMINNYLKKDGTRFKSIKKYLVCISNALSTIGVSEDLFYSTDRIFQLKLWRIKLVDSLSHALNSKDEKKKKCAQDYICAVDSFINFIDKRGNQTISILQPKITPPKPVYRQTAYRQAA